MKTETTARFSLGNIVATPGAIAATTDAYRLQCLARHAAGDWGSVSDEDKAENDLSVKEGFRILSAYPIDPTQPCAGANKLWIITEADRSVTTFLLPSEY